MALDRAAIIERPQARLNEMAAGLGNDAGWLSESGIIPDTEAVPSAGLMEFVVRCGETCSPGLQPEEMTVDNLGPLGRMADFAPARMAR